MELSPNQLHRILQRFSQFELSYETITHKKVPSNYDICLGVPSGRKYFMWFTFYRDQNVCYLLELNKEKRIVRATVTHTDFSQECHIGTVLYGSLVRDDSQTAAQSTQPFLVIEDIYVYKGVPLKHVCFADKIITLKQLFETDQLLPQLSEASSRQHRTPVYLPFMWSASQPAPNFPYAVHHIQYRELTRISPHLNVIYGLREPVAPEPTALRLPVTDVFVSRYIPEYGKPQYRFPTVFRVIADVQYDIYHLYACGPNTQSPNTAQNTYRKPSTRNFVYYDVAYIPNYDKSVFMNGLFRNIRENRNLDYIEESDEDEDFENTREDKYVDLTKELYIECVFYPKFKRWTPMRVVGKHEKVVHIHKLAK
jgi:hypothetical protein